MKIGSRRLTFKRGLAFLRAVLANLPRAGGGLLGFLHGFSGVESGRKILLRMYLEKITGAESCKTPAPAMHFYHRSNSERTEN